MHHPQMNHRRGSLEARGDGSPLPPPPAMASNLSADSRCQLGMPQPPGGPRIRHPLDFCTLRRPGGRTVQFADQQQNVSFFFFSFLQTSELIGNEIVGKILQR